MFNSQTYFALLAEDVLPPRADPPHAGALSFGLNYLRSLLLLSTALTLGCYKGASPKDQSTTPPALLTILPANQALFAGQTLQYSVPGYDAAAIAWTVAPPTGGHFTGEGKFVATTQGDFVIRASLRLDPRATGTTPLTIYPASQTTETSPSHSLGDAEFQTAAGGFISNEAIAEEEIEPAIATSSNGFIVVHHGFSPTVPHDSATTSRTGPARARTLAPAPSPRTP